MEAFDQEVKASQQLLKGKKGQEMVHFPINVNAHEALNWLATSFQIKTQNTSV